MAKHRSNWDKFWRDKEGNSTLFQSPNLPLVGWIIFYIIGLLLIKPGTIKTIVELLSFGFIFTWAYLEIFQGDSYYRRLFGLVVLVLIIINKVS